MTSIDAPLDKFAASGDMAKDFVSPDDARVIDQMDTLVDKMAEERIGPDWRSLEPMELFERLLPIVGEAKNSTPGADQALERWRKTTLKLVSTGGEG